MTFSSRAHRSRLVAGLLAVVAGGAIALAAAPARSTPSSAAQAGAARPNILWIVSEDNGPQLGAYGDRYADTPNLDRLAARGYRYRTAWSNGPVCGAARTALILGVYPESTGGEHMRSLVRLPPALKLYPALLREAGYYTSNNSKTDYNYADGPDVWNESSKDAHWKNRPAGQPFFAIFNIMQSHESQVRTRPHEWAHAVAKAPVPPYMPDVREVREDWAQYYDQLTVMDRLAGERLAELERAGLADDTIVMYYGDHGAGMPRSKRTPMNSGLQVPLLVYIPPKFRGLGPPEAATPGSESTRLVSFVDLAPTLLSLAGVQPPSWMQGHAFLGRYSTPEPAFLFGFRGRMDERDDLVRSVRDQRYVYVRNFMPHRPAGQHVAYMFETPTTAVWKRMFDEGRLTPVQRAFWEPRATEELYDLEADPWETVNLAAAPAHRAVLDRFRAALDAHERETRDIGLMPEYELHRDEREITAYERARDPKRYDFDRVYAAAKQASDRSVLLDALTPSLTAADPIVRYWAATGVLIRGREAVAASGDALLHLLSDPEPGPRIVAAEALARFGPPDAREKALHVLLANADASTHAEYVAMFALYSLSQIDGLPPAVVAAIEKLPAQPTTGPASIKQRENYFPKLIEAASKGIR